MTLVKQLAHAADLEGMLAVHILAKDWDTQAEMLAAHGLDADHYDMEDAQAADRYNAGQLRALLGRMNNLSRRACS